MASIEINNPSSHSQSVGHPSRPVVATVRVTNSGNVDGWARLNIVGPNSQIGSPTRVRAGGNAVLRTSVSVSNTYQNLTLNISAEVEELNASGRRIRSLGSHDNFRLSVGPRYVPPPPTRRSLPDLANALRDGSMSYRDYVNYLVEHWGFDDFTASTTADQILDEEVVVTTTTTTTTPTTPTVTEPFYWELEDISFPAWQPPAQTTWSWSTFAPVTLQQILAVPDPTLGEENGGWDDYVEVEPGIGNGGYTPPETSDFAAAIDAELAANEEFYEQFVGYDWDDDDW